MSRFRLLAAALLAAFLSTFVSAQTAPVLLGISGGGSVELGQTVALTIAISGSPTGLTFQWRRNGVEIPGATANPHTIAAATPADAGSYSVTVRNASGESASSTELSVRAAAPPVITVQPRTTVAQVGQSVTFSFSATGSFPRTHQWRKDGTAITGATGATLVLPALSTADAGGYSVSVTNSQGSITSATAFLTVNAATPPAISPGSPSDIIATEGGSISLSVFLTGGSSPFTYQWFKNGAPLNGATQAQLAFPAAAPADAGRYSVSVSNVAGAASSREATLVVNPATPPAIVSAPRAITVFQGQSASFDAFASGSSPLRYQWFKNGTAIAGATSSSYSLAATALADAGGYSVTVTNVAGSTTSATASLVVNPPVKPAILVEPRDAEIVEGNSGASFFVSANGSPPMTYQWFHNGVAVTQGAAGSHYSTGQLLTDAGQYHVVVSNAAGSTQSRAATLVVTPQPPPPVARLGDQSVTLGSSFSIGGYWGSSGNVTFQWYRNGEALPGATSSSYGVPAVRSQDAGDYFVIATNSAGSSTSRTARVTIRQPDTPPPGAWIAAERRGDIVYFAFANPARVERYHLVTESWLPPIALSRSPVALAIGHDALFISAGSVVYRYGLSGGNESVFSSGFNGTIFGLLVWNDYLLVQHTASSVAQLTSVRISDQVRISNQAYVYRWGPNMVATTSGKLFSRTTGIDPADITTTQIQPDGILSPVATDSPYHGAYPTASRIVLSPNEAFVADNGGTVYHASSLLFAGGLGGAVDDIAFAPDGRPVICRGGTLTVFSPQFVEAGNLQTTATAARIFVQGGNVFGFGYPATGGSITVGKYVLSQAVPTPAAAPIDASTIGFFADANFIDRDGVLYLFSKLHRQIFRWATAQRRFLEPVRLQGWPDFVTYSPSTHRVYVGYRGARILQVKLDAGSLVEEAFATAPQDILALATAGEYVFLVDPSGAWMSYVTFASDGRRIAQREWSYYGEQYAWNPVLRRMYHFRDDTSPNDLMYTEVLADGSIGQLRDSPAHGEIATRYPIRISPDGSSVLLGSGKFYDAHSLLVTNSLANSLDDAAWLGSRVYTARRVAAGTEIQRWGGANYALDRTKTVSGRLVALYALPSASLLVITMRAGIPTLTVLDAELNELASDAAGLPTRLANLAARAMVGRSDQILIPGFVITGSQNKRVLIRAAGPALNAFGVGGALADPQLTLYNSSGTAIATNDNWGSAANLADINAITRHVGAFAFPSGSLDAAALVTLNPGAYTVQTRGANDATGVALVEVYDAQDANNSSRLVNLAARAQVGTGADVLIPGIVVQGTSPRTLLIRAIGPGLTQFGVSGVLSDPRLRVYRGDQILQENDNWDQVDSNTRSRIISASSRVSAFPLATGSADAAVLVTLEPGSYTAQVSGSAGGTGVSLVEVYEVEN